MEHQEHGAHSLPHRIASAFKRGIRSLSRCVTPEQVSSHVIKRIRGDFGIGWKRSMEHGECMQ